MGTEHTGAPLTPPPIISLQDCAAVSLWCHWNVRSAEF